MTAENRRKPAGTSDAASTEESAGLNAGRVFALSDGVFAIAGTLLALDLRVPDDLDSDELSAALAELYSTLDGYVIGLLVIGLLWLGHHAAFLRFRRITGPVAALNIVLLGLVAVLPFPSSLLARYDQYPIAVVLYAADVSAVALLQVAILAVGWYQHHLEPGLSWPAVFLPSLTTSAVFAASIPVALASATAATYTWLLLIPLHIVIDRVTARERTLPAAIR